MGGGGDGIYMPEHHILWGVKFNAFVTVLENIHPPF